jgi:CRISP-associated protein Cas1
MSTLYLIEQGSSLHKADNRLVVEHNGKTIKSIPEFKVERVVVFGNIQITTQAIFFLLNNQIDTVFLTSHGMLKGRLTPIESKNSPLRVAQYKCSEDSNFAFKLASKIVKGKILNSIEILLRYQRNHKEKNFSYQIQELSTIIEKKIPQLQNVDSLRGVEGQAAIIYFQCFDKMLRNGFKFEKRSRRPPTNPVNALLSFGYTMLYQEAISAVASVGFDPYIGFYHKVDYGRCSLALDLIEEFRPVIIDRLALNLLNLKVLQANNFTNLEAGGIHIDQTGKKSFLIEYEKFMTSSFTHKISREETNFRQVLHIQALVMQKTILNKIEYSPFQGWY